MSSNRFSVAGKVVLITGGTRGLGLAMARAFAEGGADVIVASRKADACAAVAEELKALGVRAAGIPCHVGQWDQVTELAEKAWATFGRIDVLINNAGMSPLAPSIVDTSEALFDKVIDVNFKGPFRLAAVLGAKMVAAGGGSIINISTVGAIKPEAHTAPYSGAKAGLNAISVSLAKEYGPKVRVNVISPGGFLTDVSGEWAEDNETASRLMLKRYGQADEIVGTALYLASDASSYTTGANIVVDGGVP